MTLGDWNNFFNFGSVVLLGLTFLFGAGAIATSYKLWIRQKSQIANAE